MYFHKTKLLIIALMTLLFMGINLHANTLTTQEDTIVNLTESLFENNFNSDDTLTKIKIIALPSKGVLKLGTNTITLNQEINSSNLGNISFAPNLNENGTTTFQWVGNDLDNTNAITVTITINPVNDAPVSVDLPQNGSTLAVNEGAQTTVTLSATDAENDALTYAISTTPQHGTASIDGQTLTYIHSGNESTSDTIQYVANDGTNNGSPSTINITIIPVNDNTPISVNLPQAGETLSVNEGDQTTIELVASDEDNNPQVYTQPNDNLTFTITSGPEVGSATISGSTLTYQHNDAESTSDSIQYTVSDGTHTSTPSTISITINPVNDNTPISVDLPETGSITIYEANTPASGNVIIELKSTDEDNNSSAYSQPNDNISYRITTPPSFGSASIVNNLLTYQHFGNESTSDTIQYVANDGTHDSSPSTITITITPVNDAPSLTAQKGITENDKTISFTINATDPDLGQGTLRYEISPTVNGASLIDNTLSYTRPANLPDNTEKVSIRIVATDPEGATSNATAHDVFFFHSNTHPSKPIEINNITYNFGSNYTPNTTIKNFSNERNVSDKIYSNNLTYTMESHEFFELNPTTGELKVKSTANYEGSSQNSQILNIFAFAALTNELIGVSFNATLTVGDLINTRKNEPYLLGSNKFYFGSHSDIVFTEPPINGTLQEEENGEYTIISAYPKTINKSNLSNYRFFPATDYIGNASFNWKTTNGTSTSNTHTFHINVIPSAQEDTLSSFKLEDFTDNFDSSEELTKIRIIELPDKGTLKKGNTNIQLNQEIPRADLDNISFMPERNKNGTTFFKWIGNNLSQDTAVSVRITIEEVNDTPQFDETTFPTVALEDQAFSFIPTIIEPDIPEYNIDIYENNNGFSSTVRSNYLEVVNTYTHTAQTSNTITIKKNMIYNITYHGTTEIKLKKDADVLHTFNSNNITYQWALDQTTPTGNSTYKITCESNCTPPEMIINVEENPIFEFGIRNKPDWISINSSTGELSGSPTQAQIGVYRTIYLTATSNINNVEHIQSSPFSLSVTNVNDRPISENLPQQGETLSVDEGGTVNFDLIATDEDNDPLNYIVSNTNGPSYGKAYVIGSKLYYTHFGRESTVDTFEYFVNDGTENSVPSTITLQINPINDVPTLESKDIIMSMDESKSIILNGQDEDIGQGSLTYELASPIEGASISGNTLTYTRPNSLDTTTEKITIEVIALDPSNGRSQPATYTIYFYHSNKHPSKPMEINNVDFEIGEHYIIDDIIWDFDNEVTNEDLILSNNITYSMTSNDHFSINPNTGELKLTTNMTYQSDASNNHTLTIRAHGIANNEIIGVELTATISIGKSMGSTDIDNDGIPDNIINIDSGNLIIDKDIDFSKIGDLNKENFDFVIDIGDELDISSSNVSMKNLTIGSRKKSTLILKENGNLNIISDLILGKEDNYQAELKMEDEDVSLIIGNDFTIGDYGSALLNMSNGITEINGDLKSGVQRGSNGDINISGKATLRVKNNFILGKNGHAEVNLDGGKITVNKGLIIGNTNEASATFNMSNGKLESKEIIINENSTFKFSGGILRTEKITGQFKNTGGNFYIGDDTIGNASSAGIIGFSTAADAVKRHTQIIGDYVQEYGDILISNLTFTISSADEETNGKLSVTGTATVDGKLTIKKSSSMVFKLKQSFALIDANQIQGSFSILDLPTLDSNLAWDTRSLYTAGTISVAKAGSIPIKATEAFVYPNPIIRANGSGSIFYKLEQSHNVTIEIYNMFGRNIHKMNFSKGSNGGSNQNNLISIPSSLIHKLSIGPYFIVIHNGTQTLARGKFVIK